MELRGESLIGSESVRGEGGTFRGFNPARQQDGQVLFHAATEVDLIRACALADAAAQPFAALPREARAAFLDRVAAALLDSETAIVVQGTSETGLPEARLKGELARTANQLRMFAGVLRDGAYLDIRVDEALADRVPPRSDLRLMMQPVGPVAVFGASNFPLAFSVAGGDTASALAAGCPVVVKAHGGHPGTSELVGRIVQNCVAQCGLPDGVFSMLFGGGSVIGQGLVADPRIQAVGFTGSRAGGLALCQTAAQRKVPIPVYAEMSAVNPVVLLPGALAERGATIGASFAQAQTMGAGQFCTNPGLLLAIEGDGIAGFSQGVRDAYAAIAPATMLTPGIHKAYCAGVGRLSGNPRVQVLVEGQAGEGLVSQPLLFQCTANDFLADPGLSEEVFGAASLLVRCADPEQLFGVIASLEGQLAAAIHAADTDDALVARLMPRLERLAGRVLFGGFGTGVEVCDAMVHGGPFPATSDGGTTSVGSMAIRRFLRPVCYQDTPTDFLPGDLRDGALAGLPHRRNGKLILPK